MNQLGKWDSVTVKEGILPVLIREVMEEDVIHLAAAFDIQYPGGRRLTASTKPKKFTELFAEKIINDAALTAFYGLDAKELMKSPTFAFSVDPEHPLAYNRCLFFAVNPIKRGDAKFLAAPGNKDLSHPIVPAEDAHKALTTAVDALKRAEDPENLDEVEEVDGTNTAA